MPNKNEDIINWIDIIDQRNHANNIIIARLKKGINHLMANRPDESEYEKLTSFDDSLWNTLKFVQIERNYGYFKTIAKLYKEDLKIENYSKTPQNINQNQELYLKTKEFVIFFFMNILNFLIR